jgi:DNA replication protein DnaC
LIEANICEKCGGTGWITRTKDDVEVAQRCDCQKIERILSKAEKANIPNRFLTAKLDNYFPAQNNPSQMEIKKVISRFIDDYPAVLKGIILQGAIGVGKTRLLCTIATELLQKIDDLDVYYIDWNDLVREMRSGEAHASRDFDVINQLIFRLTSVDLLLFDELGGSRMSPWVYDNIYYLFNKRYNNKKVTICASNFLDEIPKSEKVETLTQRVGERIRSRLYEMTDAYQLDGSDFRKKYG